ncbi:unnamed protein product [Oppiella nova]|uniref:RRM domain-containing protein n=1 Tax=Oppiella nova TaxID=334625 RepID=A0A7R9MF73_9ACAR|nr:unnamed protein product [Oppiella nova]CAG2176144.1 unnamed protein product [Oppiella nova]
MPTRKGRLSKPVRHYHRPRAYRMAPARRHKMAVRPDNEEGRLLVSNIGPNINLDAINEVLALFGNVGKIQIHQNVDLSLTEVHRYLWRVVSFA